VWSGRRVLVTGASSGVGRALALALAQKGARLVITARRDELLERLADEIEGAGAARPLVLAADLSRRGEAADLARRAEEAAGGIDVLVNNAAGAIHGLEWLVGDRDEARELFELNFWSPLSLQAALVPAMRERGEGSVVNVTSLVQISPFPRLGLMCASKAALANATETLRLELDACGVHVLEVALGPVDTPAAAESRLLPGGKRWLKGSGLSDPESTARAIVSAIEKRRARLVYPRRLRPSYALPWIGRAWARYFARHADGEDGDIRRCGSLGDEDVQAMRAQWEERRRAKLQQHGATP
jgi:short-subunit dehydrogenase